MTPLRRRTPWKRICYNGGTKRRLLSNYSTASSFSLLKQRFLSQGVLHPASGMSLSPLVFAAGFRMTGWWVIASLIFRRY